jgi:hypothetical protein
MTESAGRSKDLHYIGTGRSKDLHYTSLSVVAQDFSPARSRMVVRTSARR